VLWTGIDGDTDTLKAIQKRLEESLSETGIPKDHRPFKGHLTMGRFKGHTDSAKPLSVLKEYADFETGSFAADTLNLYKSDLTPQGAVYHLLETVSF
jgi:2'-5' RNA ligase